MFACRAPQKKKTNILNAIKEKKGKLPTMEGQLETTNISDQSQKP